MLPGRVLKDEDELSTYKIQSGHTIHMVKGVARTQQAEGSSTQRLPTMAAGQNPSDPLTILNTPMAHGAMAGFNPFADMGLNPNDPNMVRRDSPSLRVTRSHLTPADARHDGLASIPRANVCHDVASVSD